MIYFFESFYFDRKEEEIISNGRAVSGFLSQALIKNNTQQLENWLQILSDINNGMAILIDEEGYLQMSHPLVSERGSRINFPHREDISRGKVVSSRIKSDYFERPMLLIGIPIAQSEEVFSLIVLTPVAGINQTVRQVQKLMVYSSIIAIFLAMILAYTWSKNLSNPLKNMSEVALRLSNGQYGETVSVKENNEIGTLAESINYMSKTLEETVNNLVEEKNKLKYILTGMDEGVLTINEENEIILINVSARDLFNIHQKDIEKKRLEDCIKNQEIIKVFKNSNQQKQEIQKELFVEQSGRRKRILVHCTPVFIDDNFFGIVGLMQDISKRWRFEQLQKDFVANVSHELKAPLSSIRGAGEVLLDNVIKDPAKKEEYLKIILEEANRLEDLVNNILDLSELEGHSSDYNAGKVDAFQLVSQVTNIFRKKLRENKQRLKIVNKEKDVYISADSERIKQVLLNLLDNAVKFSPENSVIEIGVKKQKGKVKFWVEDNGVGIPQKEQENIWERFYKVDKAHTPDDSGSGLGLSIVKKIVEKYGGEVFLESEPGEGSTFGFYLPVVSSK